MTPETVRVNGWQWTMQTVRVAMGRGAKYCASTVGRPTAYARHTNHNADAVITTLDVYVPFGRMAVAPISARN